MKGFLPLLILFALAACKKSNDTDSTDNCNIFPLKKGNYWTYKVTYFNQNGSVDSVKNTATKLTSTLSMNDKIYYTLDSFYYPLRNKDCNSLGLYDANTNSEFEVKNNSTSNDVESYNLPYGTGTSSCLGTKVLLNKDRVVIGGIDCYKVEYRFTSCSGRYYRRRFYYINEKIGMVKSEAYNILQNKEILSDRQELLNYQLQ